MKIDFDRISEKYFFFTYFCSLKLFKSIGKFTIPNKNEINCINAESVSIIELRPLYGLQLSNSGLSLAFHNIQFGCFVMSDVLQSGCYSTLKNSHTILDNKEKMHINYEFFFKVSSNK